MDKTSQPMAIDNSTMLPKWAQQVTTKTVKVPLSMTLSGKRAN